MNEAFNNWWNGDIDTTDNPFEQDSPAYWAWEGWMAGVKAERDKWEAKFKQLEALMQVREQQPNKPCCLAEREACAKVCDVRAVQDGWEGCYADECAAEIRARGKG